MIRSKGCRLVCFGAQLIKAKPGICFGQAANTEEAADERSAHHLKARQNTASIVTAMT